MKLEKPRDVIDALRARLTPERLARIDEVLALEVTGDDGGAYTLDARPGGAGLLEGPPESHGLTARLSATVSGENFVRLARGELKPHWAALSGKLRLRGDLGYAARLAALFG